jgi:diadenosine tetraphosphatase ApaH/serine/threonine PP2A family protein phosphatase
MENLFSRIEKHCFQGHTHIPGVFTMGSDFEFLTPEDCNYTYELGEEKVMINVGSVGQPRDGDTRACYVILNDQTVTFRRVEYDFNKTAEKIYSHPELDNMLGDRLKEGR